MKVAYYNEIDPFAAQWLRELIKAGHLMPGFVDERSIIDVRPDELRHFTQCHFFAGIGVWSYALRQSGWADDRPVWTGSCPCQPFSAAGKGDGFNDERHLWPHFHWLIAQCRPSIVFGEQVASKAAEPWIDLVQADVEALGYAFGCVAFPAAGVGAPHIRSRAYWVADSESERQRRERGKLDETQTDGIPEVPRQGVGFTDAGCSRAAGKLADSASIGRREKRKDTSGGAEGNSAERLPTRHSDGWADCEWRYCRDNKWRPVEPGIEPLAHGAAARVGRLRGYGNAIVAQQAQAFIESYLEI